MKTDTTPCGSISVQEMAVISVLSGVLLGALALCLCNAVTALCGVELRYTILSIGFRCGVAFIISLLGLLPLITIVRARNDLLSFILGGPQLALWACIAFLAGGMVRWGTPPEFMWPIFAAFILYGVILQVVVSVVIRKRKCKKTEDSQLDECTVFDDGAPSSKP